MDIASLEFLSTPVATPDTSLGGAAVSDELTKLLGSRRLRGNVREAEKFATGLEAYLKFRSKFTSEVVNVPGASKEEKFTTLCD